MVRVMPDSLQQSTSSLNSQLSQMQLYPTFSTTMRTALHTQVGLHKIPLTHWENALDVF